MSGIYLHIPYCDTKCIYCDFYSITNHSRKDEFIDAILKEIEHQSANLKDKTFDTIFFGGGTPSLLSYDDFNRLFNKLYSSFNISPDSEITIEANPGTLDKIKLQSLRKLPINRISFGVQSFIDSELKFLSRIHNSQQAEDAIKSAQDVGFDNLNLDLIFALPNQTKDNWLYNLDKAVSLNTKHISAYSLIFEEGTFLNTLLHRNKVRKADEELEQEMYEITMDYLSAKGFEQYEISNYCKPSYECRHNLKYWSHQDYISFGPSAASFINNKRFVNIKNLDEYIRRINEGIHAYDFTEEIDTEKSLTEYIFLGLRSKGIELYAFDRKYNQNFLTEYKKPIEILTSTGFALLDNNCFRLTSKGYALCDEIAATYF